MDTLDSSVVDTVSNVNPFAGYNSHCEVANMVTSCVTVPTDRKQDPEYTIVPILFRGT